MNWILVVNDVSSFLSSWSNLISSFVDNISWLRSISVWEEVVLDEVRSPVTVIALNADMTVWVSRWALHDGDIPNGSVGVGFWWLGVALGYEPWTVILSCFNTNWLDSFSLCSLDSFSNVSCAFTERGWSCDFLNLNVSLVLVWAGTNDKVHSRHLFTLLVALCVVCAHLRGGGDSASWAKNWGLCGVWAVETIGAHLEGVATSLFLVATKWDLSAFLMSNTVLWGCSKGTSSAYSWEFSWLRAGVSTGAVEEVHSIILSLVATLGHWQAFSVD